MDAPDNISALDREFAAYDRVDLFEEIAQARAARGRAENQATIAQRDLAEARAANDALREQIVRLETQARERKADYESLSAKLWNGPAQTGDDLRAQLDNALLRECDCHEAMIGLAFRLGELERARMATPSACEGDDA